MMRASLLILVFTFLSACQVDTPACSALLTCCAGLRGSSASDCREAHQLFRAEDQAEQLCQAALRAFYCISNEDAGPAFLDGGFGADAGPDLDVGLFGEDAGRTQIDAGPAGHDAGRPHHDAGPAGYDAGAPRYDAGSAHEDAGPSRVDAGAGYDAGAPGYDAGRPREDAGPA